MQKQGCFQGVKVRTWGQRAKLGLAVIAVMAAIFVSGSVIAQTLPLPAGYWGFDHWWNTQDLGCEQSRALDASPGQNCAVLKDGALCVPPIVWTGHYDNRDNPLGGRAAFFDGEDSIAQIPHDPRRNRFTDRLTVSAWVKPGRLAGIQAIVRKWYAKDSYSLALAGDRYVFTVAFPGGPWGVTVDVWADEPAIVDQWTHVAGVFDGQNRKACIYIGGGEPSCVSGTGPSLQRSQRPVTLGNHPAWDPFQGLVDEVRLYRAALDKGQIRLLAGRSNLFFGADTYVYPGKNEFPAGKTTYDFYMGSLGWPGWECRIVDQDEKDVITGEVVPLGQQCPFRMDAASIATPKRTYAFYWVQGPGTHSDPFAWGRDQAAHFLGKWKEYRHIIGGQTPFADVETERDGGRAGWKFCSSENPKACRDNRRVLEGFLQTVSEDSSVPWPGVYTSPERWVDFFGKDFIPRTHEVDPFEPSSPIPFVLWVAGCSEAASRYGRRIRFELLSRPSWKPCWEACEP